MSIVSEDDSLSFIEVENSRAGFSAQLRSVFKFRRRKWSRWEQLLIGSAFLQSSCFAVAHLCFYLLKQFRFKSFDGLGSDGDRHSQFMLSIMINNCAWELIFGVVAVVSQNHFDVIAFFLAVVMLSGQAILQQCYAETLFAGPMIFMGISILFVLMFFPLSWRVYNDVQSVRHFRMFQRVQRNKRLLACYKKYLRVITAIKIDAFLGCTMIISGNFGQIWDPRGYARYTVIVGYLLTIVSYICVVIAMRMEKKTWVVLFLLLSLFEPGYIIYKLTYWEESTSHLDQDKPPPLSKPYFEFIGAIGVGVRGVMLGLIVDFTRHFYSGLRSLVFVSKTPTLEAPLVQSPALSISSLHYNSLK